MKRRRFLTILAGTGAAAIVGCRVRPQAPASRWRGVLFNADVDLAIHGLGQEKAHRLTDRCLAEMQRLERMFSLYVPDSTLCQLNRAGVVRNPPPEFVELVDHALTVAEKSSGVFDPTIQPYWLWLREMVESGHPIAESERQRVLALADYRKVHTSAAEVRFESTGMAITLNGVAQGWITDRVRGLLREEGAEHCLVNLGEYAAIGAQPSGHDWRVGIRGAEGEVIDLRDGALAVSSGSGLHFGTGAGLNHLIDPRTGRCAEDERIVAVTAPDAATADAISTAAAVLEDRAAYRMVEAWPGAELRIIHPEARS